MELLFNKINIELKYAIVCLAKQDFEKAVRSIQAIQDDAECILKEGIFYGSPKGMTKTQIIKKYPSVRAELESQIMSLDIDFKNNKALKGVETYIFYVRKGFNITTEEMSKIKIYTDAEHEDRSIILDL
ncbi:MAG: hypothetical protein ACYDDE_00540 [bacterium]